MAGKGSKPRPTNVDRDTFESNWDRIFNKDKKKDVRVQVQDSKDRRR
jgi:hypothetical protein